MALCFKGYWRNMTTFLYFILILGVISVFVTYWPVGIVAAVIVLIYIAVRKNRDRKFRENFRYTEGNYKEKQTNISDIDKMDGIEFEQFFANLLWNSGYTNVEVTSASGDYGVDILANKAGIKYAIQCKRYSNSVGIDAIQQVYAGASYYKCDVAVVVTNSTFTKAATNTANSLDVLLWDRDVLIRMLGENRSNTQSESYSRSQDKSNSGSEFEKIVIDCPSCEKKFKVKKTDGKMLAITCPHCSYKFLERT